MNKQIAVKHRVKRLTILGAFIILTEDNIFLALPATLSCGRAAADWLRETYLRKAEFSWGTSITDLPGSEATP